MNARAPAAVPAAASPGLKFDPTIPLWGVVLLVVALLGHAVGYAIWAARADQRAAGFDQRLAAVERNQADIAKMGEAVARIDERTAALDRRLGAQEARR